MNIDKETIDQLIELKSLMDNQKDSAGSVRYVYDSQTNSVKKVVKNQNGWVVVTE